MRRECISIPLALLAAACAVMQAPSGGPEDKTPPRVIETVPAPDSAGVARDVTVRVVYSEKVDPTSFKNRVSILPREEFSHLKVRGDRVEIGFAHDLPETTFCLLIGAGVRDYHRVENKRPYLLFFSTADSIETGKVSGFITFKGKPDSAGVAELFAVRPDSATEMRSSQRARVAFARKDGSFTFEALPTDGSRFLLRGFIDLDGDGRYSGGKEFATVYPDTIALRPLRRIVEDLRIDVINPNEPGSVEGQVVNETAFKLPATVRLDPIEAGRRWLSTRADSIGKFVFASVPPLSYRVSVFIDVKPDTVCGTYVEAADTAQALPEPCLVLPDTLRLKPGEVKKLEPITVR
jgi:hypothetical protein